MTTYEKQGHEVLAVETVETPTQTATVKKHAAFVRQLVATATGTSVAVELREPDLPGSDEWNGDLLEEEDLEVEVLVDGDPAGALSLVAGAGTLDVTGDQGTYEVRLAAEGVGSAIVTVEVSA